MPRTIRLDDDLEDKVRVYCKKNDVSVNRLVNMAVKKFITEKHVIEMNPLGPEDLDESRERKRRHEGRNEKE